VTKYKNYSPLKINLFDVKNKKVVITGACGQLGKVFCKGFIDSGSIVYGVDLQINNNIIDNKNITYQEMDVANIESVKEYFNVLYSENDSIDILINNAGVSTFEPFAERTESSFDWVTNVNLKGTFFCIQEYFKYQKKLNYGNIINVASIYGQISPDPRIYRDGDRRNSEVYGATKAGVIQMTKYFAVHLAEHNIRVNSLSPGGVYNEEFPQSDSFIRLYSYRNPIGRMADAREMLGPLVFLASGASSYITGHNLVVDGGMSSW